MAKYLAPPTAKYLAPPRAMFAAQWITIGCLSQQVIVSALEVSLLNLELGMPNGL